jgi:hypothetical protein
LPAKKAQARDRPMLLTIQYVNDRPYVASWQPSVVLTRWFTPFRSSAAARRLRARRFGIVETEAGICCTRTGRRFFETRRASISCRTW